MNRRPVAGVGGHYGQGNAPGKGQVKRAPKVTGALIIPASEARQTAMGRQFVLPVEGWRATIQ